MKDMPYKKVNAIIYHATWASEPHERVFNTRAFFINCAICCGRLLLHLICRVAVRGEKPLCDINSLVLLVGPARCWIGSVKTSVFIADLWTSYVVLLWPRLAPPLSKRLRRLVIFGSNSGKWPAVGKPDTQFFPRSDWFHAALPIRTTASLLTLLQLTLLQFTVYNKISQWVGRMNRELQWKSFTDIHRVRTNRSTNCLLESREHGYIEWLHKVCCVGRKTHELNTNCSPISTKATVKCDKYPSKSKKSGRETEFETEFEKISTHHRNVALLIEPLSVQVTWAPNMAAIHAIGRNSLN